MKKISSSGTLFHKNISQYQILSALNKSSLTRQRILKQLEQLDIDISRYSELSLKELAIRVEEIMRNTYSIKYLGLNRNEMGIISRRINPLADQQFKVQDSQTDIYSIHKYFYPKPLKTSKRPKSSERINVDNLETEIKKQFEENRTQQDQKLKENRLERLKTRMVGSWCSIPKKDMNNKPSGKPTLDQAVKMIQPKTDPSKSYSRFLKQGILIIRD